MIINTIIIASSERVVAKISPIVEKNPSFCENIRNYHSFYQKYLQSETQSITFTLSQCICLILPLINDKQHCLYEKSRALHFIYFRNKNIKP